MANLSAPTPNDPASTSTPAEVYDEHSGVYGFFRRHQKKLLYSAGLFTLLTFSITAPMTAAIGDIFGKRPPRGTLTVNGKVVELTERDYEVGQQLETCLQRFAIPPTVLPPVGGQDRGASELPSILAMLRRAAIAEGFETSMVEVDRAIESYREVAQQPTRERLAVALGMPSFAYYRDLFGEAMRLGNYIRLQTLGLDTSDARVLALALEDKEKITLRVATFDEKKLKEDLQAASKLTDDELRTWFDGKDDRTKQGMQAYDLPRAKLHFGALLLAEGQFAPEQWKDDLLKDFTITDDQLRNLYEQEKETRYKLEGENNFKPFDDAAVKTELTRLVQAEQVMNQLLTQVREKLVEALKPANDELVRTQTEAVTQQTTINELGAAMATKDAEVAAKEKELAAKPDDAALKAEVEALKVGAQKAKDDFAAAELAMAAKKTAITTAEEGLKTARAQFDFPGAFAAVTKDKQGFVLKTSPEMKNGEDLKNLDALGLDLGTWPLAMKFLTFQNKGDLGSVVGRATKAVFLLQAAELDPKPLKAWDTLKPLVQGAYFTEAAKTQAEAKRKLMEEALLRLAKDKIRDKVAEIEGKKQARIDEKVQAWEKQMNDDLANAESWLAKPDLGQLPRAEYQRKRDECKRQLEGKVERVKGFEAEVTKLTEREVADEAKKVYRDVLDAAANEAGFTLATIGPYSRELSSRPRFDKAFDPTVVYLFRTQAKMKEGDASSVLQDFASSRYHVAVCTKVEPLQAQDLTRREFESLRGGSGGTPFGARMADMAYSQAFTVAALEQRYQWKPAVGEQQVDGK